MSKYDDPDVAYDREIEVEALVMRLADVIQENIEARGLTRADLARILGVSKAHISQTLSGQRNLTLKTVAEALHALDCRLEVSAVPLTAAIAAGRPDFMLDVAYSSAAQLKNVIYLERERARRSADRRWTQRPVGHTLPASEGLGGFEAVLEGQKLASSGV